MSHSRLFMGLDPKTICDLLDICDAWHQVSHQRPATGLRKSPIGDDGYRFQAHGSQASPEKISFSGCAAWPKPTSRSLLRTMGAKRRSSGSAHGGMLFRMNRVQQLDLDLSRVQIAEESSSAAGDLPLRVRSRICVKHRYAGLFRRHEHNVQALRRSSP